MSLPPDDWLVPEPSLPPRRRSTAAYAPAVFWAPFSTEAYPVPDVLAGLTFLPSYPDLVPHPRWRRSQYEVNTGALLSTAVAPVAWLPVFPSRVPRRRLSVVARPSCFAPPAGAVVVVAQRQAWKARFPDRVSHQRPPVLAGSFWTIPPFAPAWAIGCGVHLAGDMLTTPLIVAEATTLTDLTLEVGTSTTLLGEGLC